MTAFKSALELETSRSALELRRALGKIRLFPVQPQIGKLYRQSETALQVLDLIEDLEDDPNWLQWWRRWASNPRPEILGGRHLHP